MTANPTSRGIAILLGLLLTCFSAASWAQDPPAEPAEPPAATEEATPPEEGATEEAAAPEEEEAPPTAEGNAEALASLTLTMDILWLCLGAFLVFFMQVGFALVEAGFTRAKNAVNIMMKNALDFSFGSLAYWAVGWGLMYGASKYFFLGTDQFFFSGYVPGVDGAEATVDFKLMADWMFQVVFAATAATIVSGAMAERTNFSAYLIYTVVITAFIYPIFGHWVWSGSGWLNADGGWVVNTFGIGFHDFAGSTVVHSVGGWCGLAGTIVLGPRLGRYLKDGKVGLIPGHNLTYAFMGTFILWLGWFGFNPGSTLAVGSGEFAMVAVTTNLAAAAGALMAMTVAKLKFGTFDLSMTCNGALAGLVAITAPCAVVSPLCAVIIGLCAGMIVVFSVVGFDKCKIDDPVGAISVHLVCGAFGTLCVGLFAQAPYAGVGGIGNGLFFGGGFTPLIVQAIGVAACGLWTFPLAWATFKVVDAVIGLRVGKEEEIAGLDISEHGIYAYPPAIVVDTVAGTGSYAGAAGAAAAAPQPAMSVANTAAEA